MSKSGWDTFDERRSGSVRVQAAALENCNALPTSTAQNIGIMKKGLFYLLLPKMMWVKIADESNRYFTQLKGYSPAEWSTRNERIRRTNSDYRGSSPHQRELEMMRVKALQPHEIVNFIGLLISRSLCMHRGRLSKHWSVDSSGAVPKGTFGKFMARHRFEEIVRYLHFSDNEASESTRMKT
ncbi:Heat shock protein70 [Phytophthora megakarya]|uniref:Heat shock protein70 n=1 Tax=Phytophthora megakarya TaxID=4795 RepID=A0A225VQV2_9STRA|nr:Heat shock protein70 [Phytophthora megakarya]